MMSEKVSGRDFQLAYNDRIWPYKVMSGSTSDGASIYKVTRIDTLCKPMDYLDLSVDLPLVIRLSRQQPETVKISTYMPKQKDTIVPEVPDLKAVYCDDRLDFQTDDDIHLEYPYASWLGLACNLMNIVKMHHRGWKFQTVNDTVQALWSHDDMNLVLSLPHPSLPICKELEPFLLLAADEQRLKQLINLMQNYGISSRMEFILKHLPRKR